VWQVYRIAWQSTPIAWQSTPIAWQVYRINFVLTIEFNFAKVLNFGKVLTDITFSFNTKILQ